MIKLGVKKSWKVKEIQGIKQKALKRGVSGAAEFILQESNTIVPFAESTLMKTGNTDVEVYSYNATASVYYDTKYAQRLHEHPEYRFQNDRKGKWLEETIAQHTKEVRHYIAKELQKLL